MSAIQSTNELDREEVDEYIDLLHDRIQFLEEELEEAERTILEMRQEGVALLDNGGHSESTEAFEDFETDLRNVGRYINYLTTEFDADENDLKQMVETIAETLKNNVEDVSDRNHAALSLWVLLVKHEEIARDG